MHTVNTGLHRPEDFIFGFAKQAGFFEKEKIMEKHKLLQDLNVKRKDASEKCHGILYFIAVMCRLAALCRQVYNELNKAKNTAPV